LIKTLRLTENAGAAGYGKVAGVETTAQTSAADVGLPLLRRVATLSSLA
jgi:hypothetical protein